MVYFVVVCQGSHRLDDHRQLSFHFFQNKLSPSFDLASNVNDSRVFLRKGFDKEEKNIMIFAITELDPSLHPPYYGTCSISTSFISSENEAFRNQICNRDQRKYPRLVF